MNEGHEHHVEFLESREDAPEALEPAKQALDLVAPLVHLAVVLPRGDAIRLWWHDRDETQVQCQLPGFLPFVGTVHQQVNRPAGLAQTVQERSTLGRIVRLARREREGDGGSCIPRDPIDTRRSSSSRLFQGLWAVFFFCPVSHLFTFP